jgi:hypothetical protein
VGDVGRGGRFLDGALQAAFVTRFADSAALAALLIPCLFVCISCGTRWPVELAPELTPDGVEKSIVAIKVAKSRFMFGPTVASSIYFVRLEADSQYRQERVFESNYRSGDYAYLVNVSPGRYAAVGATIVGSHSGSSNYQVNTTTGQLEMVGGSYSSGGSSTSYWCFSESMIDEAIVTVDPSGVAFMGEFELSGSLSLDNADDTQVHYFDLFTGYSRSNAVMRLLHRLGNSFIADYRKDQSEVATQRFLQSSQLLADVGWGALITGGSAEDRDTNGASE